MRWMHLSDIHMHSDHIKYDTLKARELILEHLSDCKVVVDVLFVTGDFRHAKDYVDIDPRIYDEKVRDDSNSVAEFIKSIASTVRVSVEDIHIVPGNHDLSRSDACLEFVKKLRENLHVIDGRFSLPKGRDMLEDLKGQFDFFVAVVNALYKGKTSVWKQEANHSVSVEEIPLHAHLTLEKHQKSFNLLYLNTAISCGDDSGTDRESLLLNAFKVKEIKETMEKNIPLL